MYFVLNFGWYSIGLDHCLLRTRGVGEGLLNGQNPALAIRKKVRQQIFAVDISQFEGISMAKI